jgi:putative acetyltransferase
LQQPWNAFFDALLHFMTIVVRNEKEDDYPDVRLVNEMAFCRPNEAELVAVLRQAASPLISIVAAADNKVVGHILFSPVTVESDRGQFAALGLAPMAVLPEYQRHGIGSVLIREGLKACRQIGHDIVFVLGHPDYYPRFGFEQAKQRGFRCEYQVRDEAFMVAVLSEGAANGRSGTVKYRPEFGNV